MIHYPKQAEPALDILVVGEPGAPSERSGDSDVYREAIALGRDLVSGDRKTMTCLVAADLRDGGHNAGVIFLEGGRSVASYGLELHLIWFCESAEEWMDRLDFIPY